MAAQGAGSANAKKDARTGCGCLVALVIGVIIVIGIASGGGSKSSPADAQREAREYISQKGHNINVGRVDYEHVALLVGLVTKTGSEEGTVIDELAKVAQEAHDEIDGFRQELFKTDGDKEAPGSDV